ncbi:malate:quinone oxidoreductase, partial [Escherichia coli]|uniref:malate:quinone oxidoreductase n=1 Tax=Escherichia coli TaxID=562 RepID=UPI00227FFB87
GGQVLAFDAPAIAGRHEVKAYGMADTGSPPMSVPHLDARKLDGKPVVLFGPFALYSTKFLKHGSWWDLYSSVNHNNVGPMLEVGKDNLDLVQYLMGQARL